MRSHVGNRTILRDDLHQQFENLLEKVQPNERLIIRFQNTIKQKIEEYEKNKSLFISASENTLKSIENKIEKFTERI
jgi:bisphosphoglycerate-dependent phosphoglycerate mutase